MAKSNNIQASDVFLDSKDQHEELVGVNNLLWYTLWACYFIQKQGYNMDPALQIQDTMSAILLKTSGRASSFERIKHIKVKYFFIKENFNQKEITIEHCPTNQM